MFWVCVRLSKKGENHHEFMGDAYYRDAMARVWSVPKLLDFCAIYGESNFNKVIQVVHQVCEALMLESLPDVDVS